MNNSDSPRTEDEIMAVFKDARKKFELFEKFYLGLSQEAKKYLRHQSGQYKRMLLDIQGISYLLFKKIVQHVQILVVV